MATAAPIPRLPPVTRATRSLRSLMASLYALDSSAVGFCVSCPTIHSRGGPFGLSCAHQVRQPDTTPAETNCLRYHCLARGFRRSRVSNIHGRSITNVQAFEPSPNIHFCVTDCAFASDGQRAACGNSEQSSHECSEHAGTDSRPQGDSAINDAGGQYNRVRRVGIFGTDRSRWSSRAAGYGSAP